MKSISLTEYYSNLKLSGIHVLKGDGEYLWIKHESFSVIRFPEFNTLIPTENEIKRVFKELNCFLISFCNRPESEQTTNAILYECRDNNYSISKLSKNVIRDIRIGQKNLCVGFVDWDEILNSGFHAFQDTRRKVGLSDGNKSNFDMRFRKFSLNPGHKALAAKFNGEIIAFMSLIIVEDFVIIQGSFSTDEHRRLCPNNALSDFLLNYFLINNNYNNVCYGLSSIQEDASIEGLNNYKVRVGFEAIKVNRKFIIHPYVLPFKKLLAPIFKLSLKVFPKNRQLKKAHGIFKFLNK